MIKCSENTLEMIRLYHIEVLFGLLVCDGLERYFLA